MFRIRVQVTEAHWTIRIERIGFSGETMQFDEHESQCNGVRVKACIRARCPLTNLPSIRRIFATRCPTSPPPPPAPSSTDSSLQLIEKNVGPELFRAVAFARPNFVARRKKEARETAHEADSH